MVRRLAPQMFCPPGKCDLGWEPSERETERGWGPSERERERGWGPSERETESAAKGENSGGKGREGGQR